MTPRTSGGRPQALLVAAALVLVAGLAANWFTALRAGVDFPSLYEMGRGIVTGTNVYDPAVAATFPARYGISRPAGMFYPPATGFAMLPFAVFPYLIGKLLWLAAMQLALLVGIRGLVRRLAPNAGGHVWMFCAGVILLSSGLRWGMLLLQGAPLILGLLCWFVAALHGERRSLAAALAILAVAVKMTLSLPFLGLLLLQRRFAAAAASVGAWVALNALGFMRMGSTALADYRKSVAGLEAFGDINSPDPWNVLSSPRTDWTSLGYGLTGNIAVARLVTLALSGLVSLWLVREGLRLRQPFSVQSSALLLPPLVCLGSLCVYHHHYDACLFFAPVLLCYASFGPELLRRRAVWLMLPLLAMLLVLPIGAAQSLANSVLGERGIGLLKLSFPIAMTCALVGSLLVLHAAERDTVPGGALKEE